MFTDPILYICGCFFQHSFDLPAKSNINNYLDREYKPDDHDFPPRGEPSNSYLMTQNS